MVDIIAELKKERTKDDNLLKSLIEKIYTDLLKVIKFKNKNNITSMVYEVPVVIPGYPLYNREDVTFKLSNVLKKKGFKTTISNKKIIVSW
jgi:Family of unknown function (DUF5759)